MSTQDPRASGKARRADILRRLRALFSMTEARGASEAEAHTAARRAAALAAEYGLAYTSVDEIDAETYGSRARPWFRPRSDGRRAGRKPATRYCLTGISDVCGVEHFWTPTSGALSFFGRPHDVEAAHYLYDVVSSAIARGAVEYVAGGGSRRGVFVKMMAVRLNTRLHAIAKATAASNQLRRTVWRAEHGGHDVVVVQDAARLRAFEAEHAPRAVGNAVKLRPDDVAAARAGIRAGDAVHISTGVENNPAPQIGDQTDD